MQAGEQTNISLNVKYRAVAERERDVGESRDDRRYGREDGKE